MSLEWRQFFPFVRFFYYSLEKFIGKKTEEKEDGKDGEGEEKAEVFV